MKLSNSIKGLLKDIFVAIVLLAVITITIFPPSLNQDEIKMILGLPTVIFLSFYMGAYITKREQSKRMAEKKALSSGNCSKAHAKINTNEVYHTRG